MRPATQRIRSSLADVPEFRAMLDAYVRHLEDVVNQLDGATRAADWMTATRVVHRLRGTGGSYGFPQITELAAECERAIGEDRGRAEASIGRLLAVLRAVTGEG